MSGAPLKLLTVFFFVALIVAGLIAAVPGSDAAQLDHGSEDSPISISPYYISSPTGGNVYNVYVVRGVDVRLQTAYSLKSGDLDDWSTTSVNSYLCDTSLVVGDSSSVVFKKTGQNDFYVNVYILEDAGSGSGDDSGSGTGDDEIPDSGSGSGDSGSDSGSLEADEDPDLIDDELSEERQYSPALALGIVVVGIIAAVWAIRKVF